MVMLLASTVDPETYRIYEKHLNYMNTSPQVIFALLNQLWTPARDVADIFEALELPYRVVLLCSGDLSFAAAKCYDFEVWSPGTSSWLECSSCSNFEDFQARRMGMRFRREAGAKVEFPHTLNASGVALPRTFATLLGNHQRADGSVVIPKALRPYLGGLSELSAPKLGAIAIAGLPACTKDETSSASSTDVPGVTDAEIKFGTHLPLSQSPAAAYGPIADGMRAYFDYVNESEGGVYGRKLSLIVGDDHYTPADTVEVVRKLVEQDKVFAIVAGLGEETHSAVWKYLDDGSNQGIAWRTPGFPDGSWASGRAQLGFSEGDEITTISRTNKTTGTTNITFYFRAYFTVTNATGFRDVSMWLLRDDGGAYSGCTVSACPPRCPRGRRRGPRATCAATAPPCRRSALPRSESPRRRRGIPTARVPARPDAGTAPDLAS